MCVSFRAISWKLCSRRGRCCWFIIDYSCSDRQTDCDSRLNTATQLVAPQI